MSLLKNIFKKNTTITEPTNANVIWEPITTIDALDTLVATSKTTQVLIFKHSTRCGISRMVLKQFEKALQASEEKTTVYYLDLLNYRTVSNEIAARFQVLHQSPQLIVLKNGVVVAHASHYDILELSY